MTVRTSTIAAKQRDLRAKLWPELTKEELWNRKEKCGYTTIPRTMPLFMEIMDSLSSGKPISSVYLNLWCRAFDEHIITLNNKEELAFHSGFSGQRAIQTLTTRLDKLNELGFIRLAEGANGKHSFAVIINPYTVIRATKSKISKKLYNALLARCSEIGANDL